MITAGDLDEILIGTAHSCRHLLDLLKLQASRLRGERSNLRV